MENKKEIEVTCYGKKRTFKTKKEAIQFYEEGLCYCDPCSSEAGRYMTILQQLKQGKTKVSDTM